VAVVSNDGDSESAEAAAWEVVKKSLAGDLTRQVASPGAGYPKKSPFAAVRWQESQPEVKIGDEWFKLVSLDGIAASEIIAFSRRTYGKTWQMRFEEGLVELLTRMGHPPGDTVTLVVQSVTSTQTRTLTGVPMTEANRRTIIAAAQRRETSKP
jgi:hypothetical protein